MVGARPSTFALLQIGLSVTPEPVTRKQMFSEPFAGADCG